MDMYAQVLIQHWRGSLIEWEVIIHVNVCVG